jgi:hypothetical protein
LMLEPIKVLCLSVQKSSVPRQTVEYPSLYYEAFITILGKSMRF